MNGLNRVFKTDEKQKNRKINFIGNIWNERFAWCLQSAKVRRLRTRITRA